MSPPTSCRVVSQYRLHLGKIESKAPMPTMEFALDEVLRDCKTLVDIIKLQKNSLGLNKNALKNVEELSTIVSDLKHSITEALTCSKDNNQETPEEFAHHKQFNTLLQTPQYQDDWNSTMAAPVPSVWSGFYNKTLRERFDVLSLMHPRLQRVPSIDTRSSIEAEAEISFSDDPMAKLGELPIRTANFMIENCIGVLGIPLGLGLNFVIDGRQMSVPMAVEEPSVVAAASSAAKLIASFGNGFQTATSGNVMTSQIQLLEINDIPRAIEAIERNKVRLLEYANTCLCPNMKKRGGGALDIYCRVVRSSLKTLQPSTWYTPCQDELEITASEDVENEFLVVHIDVDVCEAMGANIVNTVAEGLSEEISILTQSRCGLRILTNLCMQRRARATFNIPLEKLGWKGVSGQEVAQRIIEAYNFAALDPYRAVTNNKGIMNGVDAVAVATGQDWRAIEAAAHCYASRTGQYTSLSKYEIIKQDGVDVLRGSLELPLAVGSKGGALQTHPGYAATHLILNQPSASTLGGILVSVGLAQNFAAIRAIAITGIQKGHMALHARNIAVAAGAPSELVQELCAYMLGRKSINIETAKEYLQAHAVYSEIQSSSPPSSPTPSPLPSMFYVELALPDMEHKISLNIAFESVTKRPEYIAIMPRSSSSSTSDLQQLLLSDKGYNQLEKMFMFLASIRQVVQAHEPSRMEEEICVAGSWCRANRELQSKLQLLSILINILAYRLLEQRSEHARAFFEKILENKQTHAIDGKKCRQLLTESAHFSNDQLLSIGLPLFLALWQVLHYHIEQEVAQTVLRQSLLRQQWQVLKSIVQSFDLERMQWAPLLLTLRNQSLHHQFEACMNIHAKRWQATIFLLCQTLAINPEHLNATRVEILHDIGDYIEWHGTIAHDVARHQRALHEHAPNSYLFWLDRMHYRSSNDHVEEYGKYVEEFLYFTHGLLKSKWQTLMEKRDDLFSLDAVENVAKLIQDFYSGRRGTKARRESF